MIATNNPTTTTSAGIQAELVKRYLSALAVDEVHLASAVGVDDGGVFTAITTIPFKDSRHAEPPKVLAFRITLTPPFNEILQSDVIPSYILDYDPFLTIFGGGFIITRWTTMAINTTSVTISTYANSGYSESYIVYVLKDKADERIG